MGDRTWSLSTRRLVHHRTAATNWLSVGVYLTEQVEAISRLRGLNMVLPALQCADSDREVLIKFCLKD